MRMKVNWKNQKLELLFAWAQKDKHGLAKPLPCEKCSGWYARLDTHLKGKSYNSRNNNKYCSKHALKILVSRYRGT